MIPVDQLKLSDDAPKENPWTEDRLGFLPFAERLSRVILSLPVPNGYVMGLQGEWGSGKSTAINFVKSFMDKHNIETEDETSRIEVVDFRPWIVSGHRDVISAFFKVLGEKLPRSKRPGWIDRTLRGARQSSDPVIDALATVAVVADPTLGVGSKAAAKVAGTTLNGMIDRFLAEPSLQAAYEKLRKILEQERKRFLVIIDDLDRLQMDEIRSIMQMVKTVGRLPNVLYLLAYDREIVWGALDEGIAANREGPNFCEKIVQQEIELPRPAKEDLLAILDSEIEFLTGPAPNDVRWQYLIRDGVRRWIRHPRDAQRLANAVKFSWPALEGEIDPFDLLIMEGLRLFDERVFDWVRWNRDWLFNEGPYLTANESTKKAVLKLLTDEVPAHKRDSVVRVLASLFPGQQELFGERFQAEAHHKLLTRRGIGCEAGYDAYFGLYPAPYEVSKSHIDAAIARLNDRRFLVDLIEKYVERKDRNKQPMVGRLLEELTYRFMSDPSAAPTPEMVDALFEVGDTILGIDWDGGLFRISTPEAFTGLIKEILRRWLDLDVGHYIESAFKKSNSPFVSAHIFLIWVEHLRKRMTDGDEALSARLDALGKILLPQIERAAADGTLAKAPRFSAITGAWKRLGGATAAKHWVCTNVDCSADFLSKLTLGLVSYTVGTAETTYIVDPRLDPELYDLDTILAASRKHLGGNELTKDARNRIEVVARAIEGLKVNR